MMLSPIHYADLVLQAGEHIDRLGYSLVDLDKISDEILSVSTFEQMMQRFNQYPFDELLRLNEAMQWHTELYWAFYVYKSLAFGTAH